ncbi:hypothetical protein [Aeromonas sp. sia0103]|uniref:hypothetical protein n=1 Tax=Aeromonas sp. sia0103 TaxID=2854782 RepID=UPI001C43D6E8|nr:hypothetical protein [Aeromonas sp. sia0103]MBV7597077.1 hypothetical protein [Aeromonas sp. sia0103]
MNDSLVIRSLLVDKSTGKYIKAVNEHGFDDYVQIFTRRNEKSEIVIFDFSKAVSLFHEELDKKLNIRDDRDLLVKRNTVFNTWVRLKSLTNEIMLCQTSLQVSRDAEEVLNWIYTRIPELKSNYSSATDSKSFSTNWVNEKTSALLKISNEVEAFLEVLMCHIYATVKVDISYFKTDFILGLHCLNTRKVVLDILHNELNYWQGEFRHNSMIFQCCMEDLGINPKALLVQIESSLSVEEVKDKVLSKAKIEDINDGYSVRREYKVSWIGSSIDNIDRVKILSKLLQKIDSIILLLDNLKSNTVKFNDSAAEQEAFEQSLESLVLENKI